MPLNVKHIIEPVLSNFDRHVDNLLHLLRKIDGVLVYDGPDEFRHHVRDKTVYACSIRRKGRLFRNVFPVMLGSKLDVAIRKENCRTFSSETLLRDVDRYGHPFEIPDIGFTLFVINGCLKQLPYFFTNDPTNMHVVKNKKIRCYAYDTNDKGKELNYTMEDNRLFVVRNDGTESVREPPRFFDHCPYRTKQEPYMIHLFKHNLFHIDHLANKIVVSPGHLLVKQIVKYLYVALRDEDWPKVKSKLPIVTKSIESGNYLHVLSRKTVYFKESKSSGKMVSIPGDNHRELGTNGEVFVEKNTGCYRDANLQNYPLFPYLSHMIVRQISSKVKNAKVLDFQDSYVGFFCILGSFETKNIGRTHIMVRDTVVSAHDDMDVLAHKEPGRRLYELLDLRVVATDDDDENFYVVVNEACVAVTELCFHAVVRNLRALKLELCHVECFVTGRFVRIRYKTGLIFRRMGDLYVSPADESYWALREYGFETKRQIVERFGYDSVTGHHVDLNPYFVHNAFPKNCFGFHTLKSAVFPVRTEYLIYFMSTVSFYSNPTLHHRPVLAPDDDGFSERFVMQVPRVRVAFVSFAGNNQEDCIVMRKGLKAFDCNIFYTLRFKLTVVGKGGGPGTVFHRVRGDSSEGDLLGTLVHHGDSPVEVESLSVHVKIVWVNSRVATLHFTKTPFRFLDYDLTEDRLAICVDQYLATATGNKLSNFHGQKGVVHVSETMPLLEEGIEVDLCVSPYGAFRQTMGQIKEGIVEGEARDSSVYVVRKGGKVRVGKSLVAFNRYFGVNYIAQLHLYTPTDCVKDIINDQPVKGRSRFGGMRIGNMEVFNGLEGNGIASCAEEKLNEHGDRTMTNGIAIPKSTLLVKEDMRFFKANLNLKTIPCVRELTEEESTTRKRKSASGRRAETSDDSTERKKQRDKASCSEHGGDGNTKNDRRKRKIRNASHSKETKHGGRGRTMMVKEKIRKGPFDFEPSPKKKKKSSRSKK